MKRSLMMYIALSVSLILSFSAAGGVTAESGRPGEHSLTVTSGVLGEDVDLKLYLPDSYEAGENGYPVIYILEPGLYFRFMTGITDACARLGKMPESIVVGVGTSDRWRDYTPTNADVPDGTKIPQSGGGEIFHKFLAEELIPYIDANYRTRPFTVLCGHSLGGLAVIGSFLGGQETFDGFIATSPSLWWDGEVMTARAARLTGEGEKRRQTLYLAGGNEGETVLGPIRRFDEALRSVNVPGLSRRFMEFPEATHQEVPVKAFSYGIDLIFDDWRLPAGELDKGYQAVASYYNGLSERYGYIIPVPENVCNRLGYAALGEGETDKAIEIFTRNTEEYPGSANVWDSLAEAWLKKGDRKKALYLYRKVLEIDPDNDNARDLVERLEAGRQDGK